MLEMQHLQFLQQQVLNSPQLQAALQLQQQQTKSNDNKQTNSASVNSNSNTADQMQLLEHNLLFQQLASNQQQNASPVRNRKQVQQSSPTQLDASSLVEQQQLIQYLQKFSRESQYNLVPYITDFLKNQQQQQNQQQQHQQSLNSSSSSNNTNHTPNNSNGLNGKGFADLLNKEFLMNRTNTSDQSDFQNQLLLTALAMTQSSSMPNRSTSNNSSNQTSSSMNANNLLNSNADDDQRSSTKRAIKTPDVDFKSSLFINCSCKWPSCDQQIADYSSFLQHLANEHQLDDRSTAQAKIQLELVQHLETNLTKEKKVLQAMVSHLQNQKEISPTKYNLFTQNLSSIQNNGLFRSVSKSGLSSPLSNLKSVNNPYNQLNGGGGNSTANDEEDRQSFGSSPRLCNSIPFNSGHHHLSTASPTTSPIGGGNQNPHHRHNSSYPNHSSHHSPNSSLSVNNHHSSSSNKTNSLNSAIGDLHGTSPFNFNNPLSSNFSNLNSSSLPNSSLSNSFSLLSSHQQSNNGNHNSSKNVNSVLNGQSNSLTTTSSNCSLVNGLNGVSLCNGNTPNNLAGANQSNQTDLGGLHSHFISQQSQLANHKQGPGRRRLIDKSNLGFLFNYQDQLIQGFNDPSPKGRRIVERATSDINDLDKNREYYATTDVRPAYTYASLIRQVSRQFFFFF